MMRGELYKDDRGLPLIVLENENNSAVAVNLTDGMILCGRDWWNEGAAKQITAREAWALCVEYRLARLPLSRRTDPVILSDLTLINNLDVTCDDRFHIGDLYEDGGYNPCLCCAIDAREGVDFYGISLVDGSMPRMADIRHAQRLTPAEAWIWRTLGPQGYPKEQIDVDFAVRHRWW